MLQRRKQECLEILPILKMQCRPCLYECILVIELMLDSTLGAEELVNSSNMLIYPLELNMNAETEVHEWAVRNCRYASEWY